jgi:hypothetical protein
MTPGLLLARDCIICWVTVWLAPVVSIFDMIESELVRRGVALEGIESPSPPAGVDRTHGDANSPPARRAHR